MASPLGHLAAGTAVYLGYRRKLWPSAKTDRRDASWRRGLAWGVVAFFSLLPDADSLFGILFGDFGRYHNNLTHSVFVALAIALIVAFPLARLLNTRAGLMFGLAFVSYGLHIVMDFFTVGRGVMLFWPLTPERFQAPVKVFYGLRWSQPWNFGSHLITLLNEGAWIGLACAVCWCWRAWKGETPREPS